MSGKKVSISPRPRKGEDRADAWVRQRETEPQKTLIVKIPASFHSRIKSQCALQGVNMKDAIVEMLEERFGKPTGKP